MSQAAHVFACMKLEPTTGVALDHVQEPRSWFLAAGYAVVAVDVRGTGASFGAWKAPWTQEERADSREVLDWVVSQPWSNQQVGCHVHHRAVCTCTLLYMCRGVHKVEYARLHELHSRQMRACAVKFHYEQHLDAVRLTHESCCCRWCCGASATTVSLLPLHAAH